MDEKTKKKINHLARTFYSMSGYQVEDDYDFSEACHPQETGVWNQAVIAYAILMEQPTFGKHQIDPREAMRKRFC